MTCRMLLRGVVVALVGVSMAHSAFARSIEVTQARVRLGDLITGLAEPWASLDMGPSPEPMHESRYTHDDIEARLIRAQLPLPHGTVVPRVLRVVRQGQIISEPHLANLVRQSLIGHLPPGSRIRALRLSGGVALPQGAIDIQCDLPESLESGEQVVGVGVSVRQDGSPAPSVYVEAMVDLELQMRRSRIPVLSRGSEVVVQVRSHGVLVQGSGLAQEAGSIGDLIKVLPNQGSRMVQARIVDARTVEVRL